MFIPLYDVNALKHIRLQYVTIGLILLNVTVWLFTRVAATDQFATVATVGLGYIPAIFHDHAELDPSLVLVPEAFTYITYAFLHGDFWHIATNMLFLWVFGDNVEDAMGHIKFLIFYLLCAAAERDRDNAGAFGKVDCRKRHREARGGQVGEAGRQPLAGEFGSGC